MKRYLNTGKCVKTKSHIKHKRKGLIALLVLIILLVFVILHIVINVNPVVKRVSVEKIREKATIAIFSAIGDSVFETNYKEYINITTNISGEIILIQANSTLINIISRNITLSSQLKINEIAETGIYIPLGSFTGITLLSGTGVDVAIKTLPVGAVSTKIISQFTSVGINQTKHKISILVLSQLKAIIPGQDSVVNTEVEVLIAESIIIGKIPEFYFNSDHNLNLLD